MRRSAARASVLAPAEPAPCAAEDSAAPIRLRRTGVRPLCFAGTLLHAAEADGGTGQTVIRLALYQCGDGFAVSASHEPVGRERSALSWHRAELCPTLEAALAFFETAHPEGDDGVIAPREAASAMLLHAADRAAREAALLHAFRNAVGFFLFRLCSLDMSRAWHG